MTYLTNLWNGWMMTTENCFLNTTMTFFSRESISILNRANIATIFKKGDSTRLDSYRPIALLQTFYFFFASMLKNDSQMHLNHGCPKRSTGFGKSDRHHSFFWLRGDFWIYQNDKVYIQF